MGVMWEAFCDLCVQRTFTRNYKKYHCPFERGKFSFTMGKFVKSGKYKKCICPFECGIFLVFPMNLSLWGLVIFKDFICCTVLNILHPTRTGLLVNFSESIKIFKKIFVFSKIFIAKKMLSLAMLKEE